MNPKEMLDRIKSVADHRQNEENKRRSARNAKLSKDMEAIKRQLPKVRDIVPVVRALFENNMVKFDGHGYRCPLLTDGIDHGLGFARGECGSWRTDWFGYAGGGCCGLSVHVNIYNGMLFIGGTCTFDNVGCMRPLGCNPDDLFTVPLGDANENSITDYIHGLATQIDEYIKKVESIIPNK